MVEDPKAIAVGEKGDVGIQAKYYYACVRWIFLEKGGILTFCWVGTHNPCPVMAKT